MSPRPPTVSPRSDGIPRMDGPRPQGTARDARDCVRPICSRRVVPLRPAGACFGGIERTRGTLNSRGQPIAARTRRGPRGDNRLRRAPRDDAPCRDAHRELRRPRSTPQRPAGPARPARHSDPASIDPGAAGTRRRGRCPAEESKFGERDSVVPPCRVAPDSYPPTPYAVDPPPEVRGVFPSMASPKTNTAPRPCGAMIWVLSPAAGRRAAPRRTVRACCHRRSARADSARGRGFAPAALL